MLQAVEWARYCIIEPVRLFVIGACYLSLPQQQQKTYYDDAEIPSFKEFLKAQNTHNLSWDYQLIGLIMFKGGLEIIDSDQFKTSFDRLARSK